MRDLLSKDTGVSSKRFNAIFAMVCLFFCLILNAFNIQIQTELIFCFASLAGIGSALTMLEKK